MLPVVLVLVVVLVLEPQCTEDEHDDDDEDDSKFRNLGRAPQGASFLPAMGPAPLIARDFCGLGFLSRAWRQLVRGMASNQHGASGESDDLFRRATQQDAS